MVCLSIERVTPTSMCDWLKNKLKVNAAEKNAENCRTELKI